MVCAIQIHTLLLRYCVPKEQWTLADKIDAKTKVLIIADSNMRRATGAPDEWEIHSFSGAKFRHVTELVKTMTVSQDAALQHLVIQVGVNHREDHPDWYANELEQLRSTLKGRPPNIICSFTGVSVAESLPVKQRANVERINNNLANSTDFSYIQPVVCGEIKIVEGDLYGTHHTPDTISKIIDTMITHIELLN